MTYKQATEILDKLVHHHKAEHITADSSSPNLICCECPHGKPILQFISTVPNIECWGL
jgi:hypothetical protein